MQYAKMSMKKVGVVALVFDGRTRNERNRLRTTSESKRRRRSNLFDARGYPS